MEIYDRVKFALETVILANAPLSPCSCKIAASFRCAAPLEELVLVTCMC